MIDIIMKDILGHPWKIYLESWQGAHHKKFDQVRFVVEVPLG